MAEDDGEVVAYAGSSSYRPRPAYAHTRETAVYATRALHLACGFRAVGVLHEVGFKFGRWIDTELFELRLVSSP